jgi:FkbM family methyltransferase
MGNKLHVVDKNFKVWIRDERPGDVNVVGEVIRGDTYMLRQLAPNFPEVEVIVDVGGHIGCFGILASRWWPKARIFGVEPNPRSHELMALNYRDHIANAGCKTYEGAVRYDGNNVLTDGRSATGGGFMANPDWKPGKGAPGHERYSVLATEVELFSLESIVDENELGGIDLLKLDCEGSEIDILESMTPEQASRIKAICGEYHRGREKILELLARRFPGHVLCAGSNSGHKSIGRFWCLPKAVAMKFPFPYPIRA